MKTGLRTPFRVDRPNPLVEPTGCIVADANGGRWHRMRVRIRRSEPVFEWFRVSDSGEDVRHALENRAWGADPARYARPVSDAEMAELVHRQDSPFRGAVDTQEVCRG